MKIVDRVSFAAALLSASATAASAQTLAEDPGQLMDWWDSLSSNGHLALIVGGGAALLYFMNKRKKYKPGGMEKFNTLEKVNHAFDTKTGTLVYTTGMDHKLHFSNRQGNNRQARMKTAYMLKRSIAAMPHEQREAARVLFLLNIHDQISKSDFERLRFALTYADGRCETFGGSIKMDNGCRRQNNIMTMPDAIAYDARERQVNLEGAISGIYNALDRACAKRNPHPVLIKLKESLLGGGGWHPGGGGSGISAIFMGRR